MAKEMRITFEMILDEFEGQVPTELLRRMWRFAMNLIEQLQASVDALESDSRDCHNVSTRTSEAEC